MGADRCDGFIIFAVFRFDFCNIHGKLQVFVTGKRGTCIVFDRSTLGGEDKFCTKRILGGCFQNT